MFTVSARVTSALRVFPFASTSRVVQRVQVFPWTAASTTTLSIFLSSTEVPAVIQNLSHEYLPLTDETHSITTLSLCSTGVSQQPGLGRLCDLKPLPPPPVQSGTSCVGVGEGGERVHITKAPLPATIHRLAKPDRSVICFWCKSVLWPQAVGAEGNDGAWPEPPRDVIWLRQRWLC